MTHRPLLLKFPPDTGGYLSLLLQGKKEEGLRECWTQGEVRKLRLRESGDPSRKDLKG